MSVTVHIIEVRDLVGKDSNKLSDPFVRVSVLGRSSDTVIKHGSISATFDQVFTFQEIVITQEQFEREDVYIECYDANTFFRNELIGRYTFNLYTVRNQTMPSHQFYKKWVVLANPRFRMRRKGICCVR